MQSQRQQHQQQLLMRPPPPTPAPTPYEHGERAPNGTSTTQRQVLFDIF